MAVVAIELVSAPSQAFVFPFSLVDLVYLLSHPVPLPLLMVLLVLPVVLMMLALPLL